ncbi:Bet1-like SNARE 1-1 [Orobanche gracilis]
MYFPFFLPSTSLIPSIRRPGCLDLRRFLFAVAVSEYFDLLDNEFKKLDRNSRAALLDGIEEGGIRASSSYSSHEIDEQENDGAIDGLQDRVNMLKRLSGDIHEEVESHSLMLDRMGNDMDSSRGVLSGTMDKFKTVFETKSSRRMFTLVASFVVIFLVIYYLTK